MPSLILALVLAVVWGIAAPVTLAALPEGVYAQTADWDPETHKPPTGTDVVPEDAKDPRNLPPPATREPQEPGSEPPPDAPRAPIRTMPRSGLAPAPASPTPAPPTEEVVRPVLAPSDFPNLLATDPSVLSPDTSGSSIRGPVAALLGLILLGALLAAFRLGRNPAKGT